MSVKLRLIAAFLIALVGTFNAFAQRPANELGSAIATIISPTGEFMGQGRTYQISPKQGNWFAEFPDDSAADNDHKEDFVIIRYFAAKEHKATTGGFWRWRIKVDGGLRPGQYTIGTSETGGADFVSFDGDGRGCDRVFGKFTISAVTWDCTPSQVPQSGGLPISHLTKLVMRFEQQCDFPDTKKLIGTLSFTAPKADNCNSSGGGDTGGGDTGGGDAAAPESFQVSLPTDLAVEPAVVANATTTMVPFSTGTDGSFASDVTLFATTDAQDHEDFRVELTKSTIPSPGTGDAEVRILTGPSTFPRTYQVTITAVASDRVAISSFLVTVTCDPPVILGIDQPKNITAANGSQVTLEVKPTGSGPFFYQWYKGVPGMTRYPVLAANESKLIFTTRETATYWVRVSNACGSADSNGATITTTGSLSGPARRRGGRS